METTNERTQVASQLLQYLIFLAKAGIETLPAGSGDSQFHFLAESDSNEPADSIAVQRKLENSSAVKSAAISAYPKPVEPPAKTKADPLATSVNERPTSYLKNHATPAEAADSTSYPPSMSLEQRRITLEQVSEKVTACTLCAELVSCRNRVVFGVGNITPRLVFLGEAPGADEDRTGEPFVGAAGQLLDKIISSCKLKRSEVYILNTIKCRPPRNRNPEPSELANCWQFTEKQLEILRPEFICCLGAVASKQLLKTTSPLGQLRQKFHRYRDSKVVVTYHPSYLLRTESAKKFVWEDMKMLLREMGVELG